MVKYEEAVKKPFTDLTKLVIGVVLSVIPVVHWVAKGFALESSGVGKTKPGAKMPEWKNFWNLFVKGLLSDIIAFIYILPAVVVFVFAVGFTAASLFNLFVGAVVPSDYMQTMMSGGNAPSAFMQLVRQNWAMALPTLLAATPMFLVAFVLFLIGSYMAPIGVLNYVRTGRFGAAFDFSLVGRKTFNGGYFVVWLLVLILSAILGALLGFIPVVGHAVSFFVVGVIAYTLYGQIFRELK